MKGFNQPKKIIGLETDKLILLHYIKMLIIQEVLLFAIKSFRIRHTLTIKFWLMVSR